MRYTFSPMGRRHIHVTYPGESIWTRLVTRVEELNSSPSPPVHKQSVLCAFPQRFDFRKEQKHILRSRGCSRMPLELFSMGGRLPNNNLSITSYARGVYRLMSDQC